MANALGLQADDMVYLLAGMITALLSKHGEDVLTSFDILPTDDRQALVLRFRESRKTYRIDIGFHGCYADMQSAIADLSHTEE